MYKILSKYKLIKILPFQDTFFHALSLPKKITLSKELLALNYAKYAPYKSPNIIDLLQDNYLMLWFYQKELPETIIIPESYAIFKELVLLNEDAIYVMQDDIVKIIVIKDKKLLNAFVLHELDDVTIKLSMDESQVFKRVNIEKGEYESILKKSLNAISFKDFYAFNRIDLDKKTLLNKLVNKASYPLALLIVFTIFVSFTHEYLLESKITKLQNIYKAKRAKNKEIQRYIKSHNMEIKKQNSFAKKELLQIPSMLLLDSIYSIFKGKDKAHLIDVSINTNKIAVKIQTDVNPVIFLNRLNEIKYFSRVIIQNSYKPRDAMRIISYDIEVKMLKDI